MQTQLKSKEAIENETQRKLGQIADLQGNTLIALSSEELFGKVAKELFKNDVILIPNKEKPNINDISQVTCRFGSLVKLPM